MPGIEGLSGYRIMWLFVFFDIPNTTKIERYEYTQFRKFLLKDGFSMLQYSVYMRHCTSRESMEVHRARVKRNLPLYGKVSMMMVTDKQFEKIEHFWGVKRAEVPKTPRQLEIF